MTDNSHKPLQSLNDIEYFRVTSIAEFSQCPRRWLAKLLGEGKQTESPYSTMGTAVHLAIEQYLQCEFDFPEGWDRVARDLEAAGLIPKERLACRDYIRCLADHRARTIALEWEFTLPMLDGAPPVRGHIDAIFAEPDAMHPGRYRIVIRDHKTNRSYKSVEWWRKQTQPLLYTWAVRDTFGPEVGIDFELGYVNLGELLRWTPTEAEVATARTTFTEMWQAFQVYQRTSQWPEIINDNCGYCPLRDSCPTLSRGQKDFLGSLAKQEQDGWDLPCRYQWGASVLKSMEVKCEEMKAELISQIAVDGPQAAPGAVYDIRRGSRRVADPSGVRRVVETWPGMIERAGMVESDLFSVKLAGLDKLMDCHPEYEAALAEAVSTVEAEAPTLVTRKG